MSRLGFAPPATNNDGPGGGALTRRSTSVACACLATASLALAVSACGGDDDYANRPRPPAPVNLTAAITDRGVSISPAKIGAGPVVLVIANETAKAHDVVLESDTNSAPGISQRTDPINPRGTAQIKVDLKSGSYSLKAGNGDIKAAELRVGAPRKSAQNDLLLP